MATRKSVHYSVWLIDFQQLLTLFLFFLQPMGDMMFFAKKNKDKKKARLADRRTNHKYASDKHIKADYLVTSCLAKHSGLSQKTVSQSVTNLKPATGQSRHTSTIKYIVAIASGKGGVGKSSLTYHLAKTLQTKQQRVGVIDADIYGPSQAGMLGVSDQKATRHSGGGDESALIQPLLVDGIEFISVSALMDVDRAVVWRAPIATKLIRQFLHQVTWSDLDYLLIDLPPGTGDIQITLVQQAKLSAAVVVTTPQKTAYQVAEKAIQMFERVQVPVLGVVENMSYYVCQNCHHQHPVFEGQAMSYLQQKYQLDCLGRIPLDSAIALANDDGQSVFTLAADSVSAKAFQAIAENVESKLEQRQSDCYQPKNIAVDEQGWLQLSWPQFKQDGRVWVGRISPYQLRLHCRCAACVDEKTGQQLLQVDKVAADIRMTRIDPVGRYGIKIQFSDGHKNGIYTFEVLRQLSNEVTMGKQSDR